MSHYRSPDSPRHRRAGYRAEGAEETFLVRFAREFGWRAYAIPVLVVITLWVIVDVIASPAADDPPLRAAPEPLETSSPQGPDPQGQLIEEIGLRDLPAGGEFSENGEGTFHPVGTPGMSSGEGEEKVIRYTIEIEDGLDTSLYGGQEAFARMVDATLSDPRGWTHDARFGVEHVSSEDDPDLRIRLTSVETTARLCGNDLDMETSCRTTVGGQDQVVLNEARWVRGAVPFHGDLGSYRQYLINHEFGHALGYAEHQPCSADGALAPIMMQQTLSLNNAELAKLSPGQGYPEEDITCQYNAWPYPTAE